MPANLTPQYLIAEKAFKAARDIDDKIHCLEEMLRLIPKHKGTDHLQGDLKRRLSKLRLGKREEPSKSRKGHSLRVRKEGAGQVALAGAPNAGKSSLVDALTNAAPEIAAYPFTTRAPQAAMMPYKDINVQLVDLPPLSDEHEEHWVVDSLKAADGVLVVLDIITDPLRQLDFICTRLEEKRLWPKSAESLPEEQRPVAAVFRPFYIACNKVDSFEEEELYKLFCELSERDFPFVPVSANTGRGLEELREGLFDMLGVIRIYSKQPGKKPDLNEPFIVPLGSSVIDFAQKVHRELVEKMKYARIWSENKHEGQMVNRDCVLSDGDIIELHH